MARRPQRSAFFVPGCPFEFATAVFRGDRLHHFRLFLDAGIGAVELDEQRVLDRIIQLGELVHRIHLYVVEQFDARDRDAELDRLDDGIDRAFDRIERTHRSRHGFGSAVEAQCDFGDDAERAFGADEQSRQVIAGSGFARAARGADDAAVGEHHGQPEHILAHGPVAHRVGSGCARRGHAAKGCVRARVDREEQALVADERVQFFACHARLHRDVEVFRADAQDLVHVGEVDDYAAMMRNHVAFQGSAGAVSDHRGLVHGANPHDIGHFFSGVRKYHGIGPMRVMPGLVLAVMVAYAGTRGEPVAEPGADLVDRRMMLFCGHVHGLFLILILGISAMDMPVKSVVYASRTRDVDCRDTGDPILLRLTGPEGGAMKKKRSAPMRFARRFGVAKFEASFDPGR